MYIGTACEPGVARQHMLAASHLAATLQRAPTTYWAPPASELFLHPSSNERTSCDLTPHEVSCTLLDYTALWNTLPQCACNY